MKLRNKETGEIAEASILNFELVVRYDDGRVEKYPLLFDYSNFENYEEPKEYWAIDQFGEPINVTGLSSLQLEKLRRIGNLFKSEEKTERAVEKLKAWQTAKDAGFKFDGWQGASGAINQVVYCKFGKASTSLLSFLFGGEE